MNLKSIVAIHDISCFGRCSLTVALPILSACGVQTSVIPTAVLSTHTGGFRNNTFCDLTSQIEPIANHWKEENLEFDAIYCGYLSSEKQIFSVISAINTLKKEKTTVIIDPVMGDNGKYYSGFSKTYPQFMLKLCKKADIITPNITEACLLTGIEYIPLNYDKSYIEKILKKLFKLTNAKIILTGISFDEKKIGVAVLDEGEIFYQFSEKSERSLHSTGDIFASVLTGALLNERSLKAATQLAINFTAVCIKQTIDDNTESRYGVNFEKQLPNLIKFLYN